MTAHPAAHASNNLSKWEYPNRLYQAMLARYLDRLYAALCATGAESVLDAGCGEGVVYRAMRARGYRGAWTGVDLSDGAVEYARSRSPEATWRVGSLEELPIATASVDAVVCSQVLEHIPAPARARDGIARASRGHLVVSVPWEPAFRALTALAVAIGVGQDPGHVNHWTADGFREFIAPAGQLSHWERTAIYQIAVVARPGARVA